MSKGLDAIEKLRQLLVYEMDDINFMNEVETIEKELKALEIIKNTLGISLYETTNDNKLRETHYYIDIGHCCSYLITKEQYDLLKEVLL